MSACEVHGLVGTCECPEGEVERLTALAKKVMASVAQLKVPLVIDVGQGRSWAEAH